MKVVYYIVMLLLPFCTLGQYQDNSKFRSDSAQSTDYSTKDRNYSREIALSVSPSGFIFFGPVINVEFGIADNIVLNTHIRFSSLGLLSHAARAESYRLDQLNGMAIGGGINYFIGSKRNTPYVGILIEYDKSNALYDENLPWEWTEIDKTIIIGLNIGYRYRFLSGFFINAGVNSGVALVKSEWNYTESFIGIGGEGNKVNPIGMIDIAFGIEF